MPQPFAAGDEDLLLPVEFLEHGYFGLVGLAVALLALAGLLEIEHRLLELPHGL